jgi:amidohydrolase
VSAPQGAAADVHAAIDRAVDELADALWRMSLAIHDDPELAMAEHRAAARLAGAIEDAGIPLERPLGGLETAFRGRHGSGGPHVAILMEYDALPGVGHGCGHNLIATAGLGAGLALCRAWPDHPGTLDLVGTPGEEGAGGKILLLQAGVFAGVDAAMMVHPGTQNLPVRHATACVDVTMTFHGRAAHAAGSPEQGINALKALIHTFTQIDSLREHILEDSRIHGIVTKGGDAPNIVPELAQGKFLVRARRAAYLEGLVERVKDCARGAALAAGARVDFEQGLIYAERKNNRVLADRYARYFAACGETLHTSSLRGGTGSSDVGNVSLELPTIQPYIGIAPEGTAGHSHAMAEAAASERGRLAMLHAAAAMAHTAADLLASPALVEEAWQAFRTSEPD